MKEQLVPRPQPKHSPRLDPFSPLDPMAIGAALRKHLELQELENFPPVKFSGAGLYALYYVGGRVNEYQPLVESYHRGQQIPIYIGKAAAENSNYGYEPDRSSNNLHNRIAEHARSVGEVEASLDGNLQRADFKVRYLPLEDAWITLGERALLRAYRPILWNSIVKGFGSNPPGEARKNARSIWDTIHPGRQRAGALPHRLLTLEEMRARIHKGVNISLMSEGPHRDEEISELRRQKPTVIWALPEKNDPDRRLRVSDKNRFLSELERIGAPIPAYRLVSADEVKFKGEI